MSTDPCPKPTKKFVTISRPPSDQEALGHGPAAQGRVLYYLYPLLIK
jgi:hypothetical protein